MRLITPRKQGDPEDPDAYWRRRFIILGGGLAVLMLLAWMFGSGGPSKQSNQTAAARASVAARQAQAPLPPAALGSPSPGLPASPSASASASPSSTASDKPGATPSPSKARRSPKATVTAPGGKCGANSIVLSLFTSQPVYRPSEQPRFDVYAVSTASSGCKMPYGPGVVRVQVTRHGHLVWDSAGCKTSGKPGTVSFAQGVPQEVTLSWNRKASPHSCAGSLSAGKSGTFQAVATASGHSSPVRAFKLLR